MVKICDRNSTNTKLQCNYHPGKRNKTEEYQTNYLSKQTKNKLSCAIKR